MVTEAVRCLYFETMDAPLGFPYSGNGSGAADRLNCCLCAAQDALRA